MALATSSLTAPFASISEEGTPSDSVLAALEWSQSRVQTKHWTQAIECNWQQSSHPCNSRQWPFSACERSVLGQVLHRVFLDEVSPGSPNCKTKQRAKSRHKIIQENTKCTSPTKAFEQLIGPCHGAWFGGIKKSEQCKGHQLGFEISG